MRTVVTLDISVDTLSERFTDAREIARLRGDSTHTVLRETLCKLLTDVVRVETGLTVNAAKASDANVPMFTVESETENIGTHRDEDELDGFQNRIRLAIVPANDPAIGLGNFLDDTGEGTIHVMVCPLQLGG